MIGGAEKYMATCRRCFKSKVMIPASPRPNSTKSKENCSTLGNMEIQASGDKSPEPGAKRNGHDSTCAMHGDGFPAKKALFDQDSNNVF